MHVRILGSAAGGGLPQWNCGCSNCRAARDGSPYVRPRTQSSVAISAEGKWWFLLNVSADVRQQLFVNQQLGPAPGNMRGTSIAGCVLTDAEIDHTSGLLQLREGCVFSILSTPLVRRWLNDYFPIGPIVSAFSDRPWLELPLEASLELTLPDGTPAGLEITAFETGRDVPRFVPEDPRKAVGSVVGLRIRDTATGGTLVYAPGVPAIDSQLEHAVDGADLLLLDGSFWSDEEPRQMGITDRTSQAMGHVPVDGSHGSLEWLAKLPVPKRVYVHMNNTNPMLDESGPEHARVQESGVQVGMDGDEFIV
ncbi:MAG: pyrroloquinoline quinone biosynthesis protein PqqB [Planctomycetes bacterium]|nr:pyrroloquinoline quinone biosynthesis protein PqqB [Planctomycetota bacterium]